MSVRRDGLQSVISILLVLALLVGLGSVMANTGRSLPDNPIANHPDNLYPEVMSGEGSLTGEDESGDGEEGLDETEPPTEETEPPTEETEPPTEETEPPTDETEPPTEETEPPTEETEPPTEETEPPTEETEPPTEETEPPTEETEPEQTEPEVTDPDQTEPEETDPDDEGVEPTAPEETGPTESGDKEDGDGDDSGGTPPDDDDGGGTDSGEEGDGDVGGDGDGGTDGGEGGTGDGSEDNSPRIYTDLRNNMYFTESDLPDGILSFQAYPVGEGENLTVKVVLQNDNTPATGTTLISSDGKTYNAELVFNDASYITIYLKENGENIAYVKYKLSYYADKANKDEPEVGEAPPTIITSLDGESLDITQEHLVFWVRATTHPDLGGNTIYSNQIEVRLDGELLEKQSGDSRPEYDVYFPKPNVGGEAKHEISVLAWDNNGNSTYKYYEINYHQIEEGDLGGTVTVVIDATTVGRGIRDSGIIEFRAGETVASVVLRFLEDYGYTATYDGTATNAFYLRKISRADFARGAKIPDDLREMIERDGIPLTGNSGRDSLGEFDFTMGSGWMYTVDGVVYPGRGMSAYPAQNGSVIYLRFTLAYGKDIGGYDATGGGGYGSLSSYCRVWINGTTQDLGHNYEEFDRLEPTATEDGYIEYRCTKCHDTYQDLLPATGDGTEPPTEETEPPTEETEPPTEETEPPTEETEPPTEETEPPTDETEPPTEKTEPPTEETDPPPEPSSVATEATEPPGITKQTESGSEEKPDEDTSQE